MSDTSGAGKPLLAVSVMVACCAALPLLLSLGAGAVAVVGGTLLRYWPLTALGLGALAWAGVRLVRLMHGRQRAARDGDGIPS